jgi:hypothetical protein
MQRKKNLSPTAANNSNKRKHFVLSSVSAVAEVQEQLCLKPPPSTNITFSDIILHKLPTVMPA